MTIVTITSDWNKGDYYLGALKGKLISMSKDIQLVEIANSIPAFDVLQEIFILKNSYNYFPKGSIHLLGVMSEPSPGVPMVVVFADNHYFIGVNDGRFSLLFDSLPAIAFAIEQDKYFSNFSALDLFVRGVESVIDNSFELNTFATNIKKEITTKVVYNEDSVTGRVVYIDSFGNAVTNIERKIFNKLHRGRDFTIFVQGPYTKINTISHSYSQHLPGEILALFNSLGLLEIAVNQGNIAMLENLNTASEIRIKFNNG
ncbi:MAG: SAM-dependent chlorinase/fluorinase [Rikenellaceae bacterium]